MSHIYIIHALIKYFLGFDLIDKKIDDRRDKWTEKQKTCWFHLTLNNGYLKKTYFKLFWHLVWRTGIPTSSNNTYNLFQSFNINIQTCWKGVASRGHCFRCINCRQLLQQVCPHSNDIGFLVVPLNRVRQIGQSKKSGVGMDIYNMCISSCI